jgi:hypothetical protein
MRKFLFRICAVASGMTIPAVATAFLLAVTTNANAAFQFGTGPGETTPTNGDILSIKLQNWEPSVAEVTGGGFLFGVGRITEIFDQTKGADIWQHNDPGQGQLTFTFNNYALNVAASTASTLVFTGGTITIYYSDIKTVDTGANFAEGTNLDPALNAPGFKSGTVEVVLTGHPNSAIGVPITGEPVGTTLTTDAVNTVPLAATGLGFLDVVFGSGPLATTFNGNSQADGADMKLQTTLQPVTDAGAPGDGNYAVFSNDPISTSFVGTPEPGTMLMWGGLSVLVGIGAFRRKKAVTG